MVKRETVPPPTLNLVVSLPPSINAQYATVEGRRILTETARKWKKEVAKAIERLEDSDKLTDATRAAFHKVYLAVFLEFYFTSPHKRDLDGGLKITLDAVCAALDLNDNRVVDLHLVKRIDPLRPRLEITLEGVPDWEFDEQYVYLGDAESEAKGDEGQ